jgi:saccharopine dehydrogenase (NAD+, L-lysine-forming)
MEEKKFIILGGYGHTGRLIARLLLSKTEVRVVLAGRNGLLAEKLTIDLNREYEGQRVSAAVVDASKPATMLGAFRDLDLIIVASSTAEYTSNVAQCALDSGLDYLDVQYSTSKLVTLRDMSDQITDAGRCFITDGGFHPGLPAALIRYVAPRFEQFESARVGSVIQIDWASLNLSPATMTEFVGEFMDFKAMVYEEGCWNKLGTMALMKPIYMDFGPRFGRRYGIPMFLEEMRAIPEFYPEIKETAFCVGGFNWFVDWLLSPLIMLGLAISPKRTVRPLGRMMLWGLERFSSPPYGTMLKVEARGQHAGEPKSINLTVFHPDGYMFTAIPVVACLLQYLDGSIRKPGLWFQANVVDPNRLMADMENMGVEIERLAE